MLYFDVNIKECKYDDIKKKKEKKQATLIFVY